jgi:hypothetical protein
MKLYEKQILNGKDIVVVYQKEGIANAKAEFPELTLYSFREIEALEGLDKEEQEVLQQAKQILGGSIFTEENFNKYYPKRKGRINVKKQRI